MRRPSMTTSRAVYAPIYGWDHCLPHWTTPELSEARYVVTSPRARNRASQPTRWIGDPRALDCACRISRPARSPEKQILRGTDHHRLDGLMVRTLT